MPPREEVALLEDALGQVDDLLAKARVTSLDRLLADSDLQAIFERRFEILGEALRRLERQPRRSSRESAAVARRSGCGT